jgi:hypothetical protein
MSPLFCAWPRPCLKACVNSCRSCARARMQESQQPSKGDLGARPWKVTHQGSVAIGVKPVEGLFRFVFNLSKTTPPSDPGPAGIVATRTRCMWRPCPASHVSVAVRVYELGGTGTRHTESARCCEAKAPAPCLGEGSGNDIPSRAITLRLPPCCFRFVIL